MTELHLTYGVVGAIAVALALLSRRMRSLPLSEPLVALTSASSWARSSWGRWR